MRSSVCALALFLSFSVGAAETPTEPLLTRVRQITFSGQKNGEAYFSADGERIVFQGVRVKDNPFYQIYSMELDSRKAAPARLISSGVGRTTCAFFHPTKKRMLFSSTHLDPASSSKQREEIEKQKNNPPRRYSWDFDPEFDIFETDVDGGKSIQLTGEKGYDAEAAYSPDGKKIVFCSFRDGDGEIYVMNSDGSQPKRLTHEKGYDGGPFFSPDGTKICWRHFADEAQKVAEIWIMDADGGNKKQITSLNAISWAPYWHPGGEWLVFGSNFEDPAFDIYAIRTDGSKLTRVTNSPGFDGLPVISPDGATLMWTSNRTDNRSQVFMARLEMPERPDRRVLSRLPAYVLKDEPWDKLRATLIKSSRSGGLEHELARELASAGVKPLGRDKSAEESDMIAGPTVSGWKRSESGKAVMVLAPLDPLNDHGLSLAALIQTAHDSRDRALGLVAMASQREALSSAYGTAETALTPRDTALSAAVVYSKTTFTPSKAASSLLPKLVLHGAGTSPVWPILAEVLAQRHPFVAIELSDDPGTSPELEQFTRAKVACVAVEFLQHFTLTLDSEEATIQIATIESEQRLLAAAAIDLVRLLQSGDFKLDYTPYDAVAVRAAQNAGARPYLGTIPEYKSEGAGVKLKGTREGSPAEKAGIKAGDVLIELAGKPVKDVEAYLQVLESLKPGEEVKLKVQRGAETLELSITPATR